MPQKHIFARHSFFCDAPTPQPEFDVIGRIQRIRQSLCGIVSSRNASAVRAAPPQLTPAADARRANGGSPPPLRCDPQDFAGGRFLRASQRRVEELLRDNHQLELSCLAQEETIKDLRSRLGACDKRAEAATDSRQRAQKWGSCNTPSPSRRGTSGHPATGEGEALKVCCNLQEDASRAGGLAEDVRHFVEVALSLFPRLMAEEGSSLCECASEVDTARVVLKFVAHNLAQWQRLSRECAEMGRVKTGLSRMLVDIEMNQQSWYKVIMDIAKRLKLLHDEQRRCSEKKNRELNEMRIEANSLAAELSDVLTERDAYAHRCRELERTLCDCTEKAAMQRSQNERLQLECEELYAQVEALQNLTLKNSIAVGGNNKENNTVNCRGKAQEIPEYLDITEFKAQIQSLKNERNALQEQLKSIAKTLAVSKEEAQAAHEEKGRLAEQVEVQRNTIEAMQQELEELRHGLSLEATEAKQTPVAPVSGNQFARFEQNCFLRPIEIISFDTDDMPRCDANNFLTIRDIDVDIASVVDRDKTMRPTDLFFHIGCSIAGELGFFEGFSTNLFDAWKRFLLEMQAIFIDNIFYTSEHAADCVQFFYALLFHSGVVQHMGREELLAAVTAAMCVDCGRPGLSASFLVAAQDPGAAGTHGEMLFERRCVDSLARVLKHESFDFLGSFSGDSKGQGVSFFDEIKALLLPEAFFAAGDGRFVFSRLEHLREGALRLQERAVRREFVRLFLLLARYSFTMRPSAVSERWGERWFSMLQKQAEIADELSIYGFALPQNGECAVADAQLVLIEHTVLPLCKTVVEAFPQLRQCEEALVTNRDVWLSRKKTNFDFGACWYSCFFSQQPLLSFCKSFVYFPFIEKMRALENNEVTAVTSYKKNEGNSSPHMKRLIERGLIVLTNDYFFAFQKELLSVYEENKALREFLETLLVAAEAVSVKTVTTF